MPSTTQERVQQQLQRLVGLPLVITRRAADLRGFHFGELRSEGERTSGDLVLHVQCPWRVDGPDGVVTGRADLWEPVEPLQGEAFVNWDWERDGNLQDRRIGEWLLGVPGEPGDTVLRDPASRPVVLATRAASFCGAEIDLSGGYRLTLFPAGSTGEDWRLFGAEDEAAHFVVGGGRIEEPDDE